MSTGALDSLIHDPERLRIVATLAALPDRDALSVTRLQDMIGLTPGSLITNLREPGDADTVCAAATAYAAEWHDQPHRGRRDAAEETRPGDLRAGTGAAHSQSGFDRERTRIFTETGQMVSGRESQVSEQEKAVRGELRALAAHTT